VRDDGAGVVQRGFLRHVSPVDERGERRVIGRGGEKEIVVCREMDGLCAILVQRQRH
jgi:hypothetical protein